MEDNTLITFNRSEFLEYFESLLLATDNACSIPAKSTLSLLKYLPKKRIVYSAIKYELDQLPPHRQLLKIINTFKIPKAWFEKIGLNKFNVLMQFECLTNEMDPLNDYLDGIEAGFRMKGQQDGPK